MSKANNVTRKRTLRDLVHPDYPRNRAQRWAAYRELRHQLTATDPLATLANCRRELQRISRNSSTASDPGRGGCWLPSFSYRAFAAALANAERSLVRDRGAQS